MYFFISKLIKPHRNIEIKGIQNNVNKMDCMNKYIVYSSKMNISVILYQTKNNRNLLTLFKNYVSMWINYVSDFYPETIRLQPLTSELSILPSTSNSVSEMMFTKS